MQLNKAKNKFMTCVTGRKAAVKVPAKSTFRLWFLTGCWFHFTTLESIFSLLASTGLDKLGIPSGSYTLDL